MYTSIYIYMCVCVCMNVKFTKGIRYERYGVMKKTSHRHVCSYGPICYPTEITCSHIIYYLHNTLHYEMLEVIKKKKNNRFVKIFYRDDKSGGRTVFPHPSHLVRVFAIVWLTAGCKCRARARSHTLATLYATFVSPCPWLCIHIIYPFRTLQQ